MQSVQRSVAAFVPWAASTAHACAAPLFVDIEATKVFVRHARQHRCSGARTHGGRQLQFLKPCAPAEGIASGKARMSETGQAYI